MLAGLRGLAREPLVHFALLGAILFWLDRAVSGGEDSDAPADAVSQPSAREPIVVDDDVRATLAQQWTKTHVAPPTPEQLDELVQDWIDDEVLVREALARGLDRDDPQIRARLASQMAYVLLSRVVVPEPSDAELRAWLDEQAERFGQPDRFDFTQVFIEGRDEDAETRARELLAVLEGGADPDGLGDTFSGGRRFRGRKLADLTARFGEAFTDGLQQQPLGTWTMRPSPFGLHLVRVDRRSVGSTPGFEDVRDAVLHDWQEAYRQRAVQKAARQLRAQWEVVVSP